MTATYYKRLWRILDGDYGVVLVILDEIDKLEDDALLMQLSRAGEAGKLGGERDGSGVSSISDPRDV